MERKCQCCGTDISMKRKNALSCSEICAVKMRHKRWQKKDSARKKEIRANCKNEELKALNHLEKTLWIDGVSCPFCESEKYYELKGKSCRLGLKKCAKCRKEFTVRHTLPEFKKSKLSYFQLAMAIEIILDQAIEDTSSDANELDKITGTTRKTSLAALQRARKVFMVG